MAGMIDKARNAPAPASSKKDSGTVTPDSVRAKMKLPAGMEVPYEKIVLVAKKIMYSQQLKPQVMQLLKGPGTIGQKLGNGVVALMAIVQSQTNNTLPPQLIIPVATEMVAEAGDFMRKAGAKVTDHDIAEGMAVMVGEILQRAGMGPEQVQQILAQQGAPAVSPDGQPQQGA